MCDHDVLEYPLEYASIIRLQSSIWSILQIVKNYLALVQFDLVYT